MTVLLAALQLASSAAAALRDQYYNTLAREAAEAGAVFMGECIKRNEFDINEIISPEKGCRGENLGVSNSIYTHVDNKFSVTFIGRYQNRGSSAVATVEGKVELKRPDGVVWKTYTHSGAQYITTEHDPVATRASHRWWYFGDGAVLDFKATGSQMPTTYKLAPGAGGSKDKNEGVTVVSDATGKLLFYSDGLTVWNGDGGIMQNGANLGSTKTTTQAVASFPIDKNERYYVVVANSASSDISQGVLSYSVIDMTLDGGKGGVMSTAKGIAMGESIKSRYGANMAKYSSEALNAMPMSDGSGYWVYTYTPTPANNKVWGFRFREKNKSRWDYSSNPVDHDDSAESVVMAYDATASDSAKRSPICDPTTKVMPITTGRQWFDTRAIAHFKFGSINFSNDYSKMLLFMGGGNCSDRMLNMGTVHVLNTDSKTGLLTKHVSFWAGKNARLRKDKHTYTYLGYTADFSPSGRYVYVSTTYGGRVRRFDISSGSDVAVQQSMRFVGISACADHPPRNPNPDAVNTACPARLSSDELAQGAVGGGQVLRGPDGRVYVADAHTHWLSVIHSPDAPTPAGSGFDDSIADAIGWKYGGDPGGLRLSFSFLRVRYGLPQMATRYSPRIIQY